MVELPPFLEDQTEEAIRQRMLDRMPDDLDKSEGSLPWDTIAPVAIELILAAEWAKEVLRRGFVATTFGQYLDLKAEESGLTRRAAVAAKTAGDGVKFTGDPGAVVPSGYQVSTGSTESSPAALFRTLEEVVLDANGEALVAVEAVEAGKAGNVPIGAIKHLTEPLDGVASVVNIAATQGGLDEEDDETLRQRILEEDRKEEGDGNIADYIAWAKEVPGVGNVLVEPLWQGEGTVRVIILDPDGRPAPAGTVDAVQEHLDPDQRGIGEGRAPASSRVTVDTAETRLVNVTIPNLEAEPGYTLEQAKTSAESALNSYLLAVNPGGKIKVREAESVVIQATGISNVGDLLLDGNRIDITLEVNELAELGSVTYL